MVSQAERLRQLRDPNRGVKIGGSSSSSSSSKSSGGGMSIDPSKAYSKEEIKSGKAGFELITGGRDTSSISKGTEGAKAITTGKVSSSSQTKTVQPASASTIKPYSDELSFGEATEQSASKAGTFVKESFFTPSYQRTTTFGDIFNPYKRVLVDKVPKSEKVAYTEPQFGTIRDDVGATKDITYGEIQEREQLKQDIKLSTAREEVKTSAQETYDSFLGKTESGLEKQRSFLQSQVDTGKISVEQAQNLLDTSTRGANINLEKKGKELSASASEKFEIKAQEILSSSPDILREDLSKRRSLYETAPSYIETGAIVGASLTGTGVVISGAYLTGKGSADIQKGILTKDIKTAGAGALSAGAGLVGLGVGGRIIERGILKEELKGLNELQFETKNVNLVSQSGKLGYAVIQAERGAGGLTQELTITGDFTRQGNKFVLARGEGTLSTGGTFADSLYTGDKTKILAGEVFEIGIRGFSIPVTKDVAISLSKNVKVPFAETSIIYRGSKGFNVKELVGNIRTPRQRATTIDLGFGISQKRQSEVFDDFFITTGGKIKSYDIGTGEIRGQVTSRGAGTNIKVSDDLFFVDKDISVGFSGGGRKSSQQYFQKLYQQDQSIAQSIVGEIKATPKFTGTRTPISSSPQIQTTKQQQNLFEVPKSEFYGKGMYERTEPMQIFKPMLQPTLTPLAQSTKTKSSSSFGGSNLLKTNLSVLPVQKSFDRILFSPTQAQSPKLDFKLQEKPLIKQKFVNEPIGTFDAFPGFDFGFRGRLPGLPILPLPKGLVGESKTTRKSKRKLTRTPSFGASLRKQLGFEQVKGINPEMEMSGLFERAL